MCLGTKLRKLKGTRLREVIVFIVIWTKRSHFGFDTKLREARGILGTGLGGHHQVKELVGDLD